MKDAKWTFGPKFKMGADMTGTAEDYQWTCDENAAWGGAELSKCAIDTLYFNLKLSAAAP